ncbi:MAG: SDR family oxidoreductase [Polyangiaceae bacterium]|nr:SDR family oxidoreductase [Polyangiaceae bacterium]
MAIPRSLDGQVALVTGGGRGIGRAIAMDLAARGARLVVTGRDESRLAEVVGEIAHGGGTARHVAGDVRDPHHLREALGRAVDTWGRLDIAVANAGVSKATRLGGEAAESQTARAVLETNLLGTFFLFDLAVAMMKQPGRLIAISSVLGKLGVPGQSVYCAAKAGIHGFVRAAAVELGPRGITCNAVCPGWVDTDMARARFAEIAADHPQKRSPQEVEREFLGAVPLRRFVEPEEVAGVVAFLCSPAAAAITGQAISVCGGATAFAG